MKIGVPTSNLLIGRKAETDSTAFVYGNINDRVLNLEIFSHMSSDFCGPIDNIIKNVIEKNDTGKRKSIPFLFIYAGSTSKRLFYVSMSVIHVKGFSRKHQILITLEM